MRGSKTSQMKSCTSRKERISPTTWRREREAGVLQAPIPQERGPKSKRDPVQEETAKMRRENERIAEQLRKAEIVIDVPKKSGRAVGVADPRLPTRGGHYLK